MSSAPLRLGFTTPIFVTSNFPHSDECAQDPPHDQFRWAESYGAKDITVLEGREAVANGGGVHRFDGPSACSLVYESSTTRGRVWRAKPRHIDSPVERRGARCRHGRGIPQPQPE